MSKFHVPVCLLWFQQVEVSVKIWTLGWSP